MKRVNNTGRNADNRRKGRGKNANRKNAKESSGSSSSSSSSEEDSSSPERTIKDTPSPVAKRAEAKRPDNVGNQASGVKSKSASKEDEPSVEMVQKELDIALAEQEVIDIQKELDAALAAKKATEKEPQRKRRTGDVDARENRQKQSTPAGGDVDFRKPKDVDNRVSQQNLGLRPPSQFPKKKANEDVDNRVRAPVKLVPNKNAVPCR